MSNNHELDARFLHNRLTDFFSVTWTSLGSTLATRWYKVGSEVPILHGAIWSRGRLEGGGKGGRSPGFNKRYIRRIEDC